MSTDLQLHHELPKLRIAVVKMDIPSDQIDNRGGVKITDTEAEQDEGAAAADEDESYRTPTSKESRIPAVMTCPPAPRKPKTLVSCKRKLLDSFQFFEVANAEDMEAFFRSTFPKRSCTCT